MSDPTIVDELGPEGIASLMREAGDWLFSHAYSVALPTPVFEFREFDEDEDDALCLLRNKFPKLTITIEDKCTGKQLADALRAASEYVRKRSRDNG